MPGKRYDMMSAPSGGFHGDILAVPEHFGMIVAAGKGLLNDVLFHGAREPVTQKV